MNDKSQRLPNVAVLMATYNGEKFLEEQVESIQAQESVNVYLYIRDDNSSDNTVELILKMKEKYTNIFLLDSIAPQLRVTKNFYSIVRDTNLTEMEYMAYSDQDDIWMKNKLSEALREMANRGKDCYASNLILGDDTGKIISGRSFFSKLMGILLNKKNNQQTLYDHYLEAASAGCTLVLSKDAALYFQRKVRKIYNEIPPDASHDWSTYAITRLGKFSWFIDKRSFIIYRQHGQNAYGANRGMGGASKLLELFRSGWYRRHILMIEDLYNDGKIHPAFIEDIRSFQSTSIVSRFKTAFALAGYRRKLSHRILLFLLIISGQFK